MRIFLSIIGILVGISLVIFGVLLIYADLYYWFEISEKLDYIADGTITISSYGKFVMGIKALLGKAFLVGIVDFYAGIITILSFSICMTKKRVDI